MKEKIIFEEEQQVIGTWIWYLVITMTAIIVGGTLVMVTLVERSTNEGYVPVLIAAIIMGCVIAFIATIKLYTIIGESKIYYRFPPFISKEKYFGKDDIQEMMVRKYKPIREYGGYGYRFSFRSGKAFNVSGNMGLQLVFKNGKRLLIGTRRPDSMQRAIKRLKQNWEMNG